MPRDLARLATVVRSALCGTVHAWSEGPLAHLSLSPDPKPRAAAALRSTRRLIETLYAAQWIPHPLQNLAAVAADCADGRHVHRILLPLWQYVVDATPATSDFERSGGGGWRRRWESAPKVDPYAATVREEIRRDIDRLGAHHAKFVIAKTVSTD
jgi:hypothetical protein